MRKVLFFSLLILFSAAVSSIRINEIMANPIADESLNEWIELYNNESTAINLSSWIIGDSNDNDTIEGGLYGGAGTILEADSYAIITDDSTRVYNNFNVSQAALRLYTDDSSIGSNGLSNSGENIYIYNNNGALIHSITYNSTDDGNTWAYFNQTWSEANSTPGSPNNGSIIEEEQTQNNECDFTVSITSEQNFFDNPDDFAFKIIITRITGSKTNITLFRQITNQYGEIEKAYNNITNEITNKRTYSYSPNLDRNGYIVNTTISTSCNDTNLENNHDTKLLIIRQESPQEQPAIAIERLYDLGSDNKSKYGQTIKAKINAYKGNSTKTAVELWAELNGEKISKITKTNVYDYYTNYTLTLPVQLKPNCERDYEDGNATLILEGLDNRATYSFIVEDISKDMCEYVEVEETGEDKKGVEYLIKYIPDTIFVGEEFEVSLKINNNDDIAHKFEVWSYVYRGNKCYSSEREANKQLKYVAEKSSKIITMKNKVEEADNGLYKFKIKILKDDLKTPNELTKDIIIENKEDEKESIKNEEALNETKEKEDSLIKLENKDNLEESEKSYGEKGLITLSNPRIIYQSTTQKAKNLAPYLSIFTLLTLTLYLVMRKL